MKKKLLILAMFILLILAAIPSAMAAGCTHPSKTKVTIKQATCTAAGVSGYKCTKCGQILSSGPIPSPGHNWMAATCTTAKKCRTCGKFDGVAPGHNMGSWTTTVSPTCVTAGRKERKCTKCSYTESQGINVTAHTYRWVTTSNATCFKAGEKKYACSYCEAVSKTESIPKIAHTMGSWSVTAATCTKDGQKVRSCTRSGCTYKETEVITKPGHSMGSWTTKVNPTCVTAGRKDRKCTKCSYTESQSINVTAHTYQWVTTSNATCSKAGEKKYACSYCEAVSKTESIPKIAHAMSSWSVTPATCTKDGQKVRSCTRSGCTYKETEVITKPGHSMGSWTTTYESNCVNPGQQERKCSNCSYKETQALALKPHTYQWVTTNNPTCTQLGEKRYMCSYCDYWEQSEPVAKVPHTMGGWTINYDSDCVNPGQKERKCDNCSYKETQGIALKPHTYQWVTTNNPTCTEPGEKRYMCSYCDYWEESEPIKKLGHDMGDWEITYEPNCVNPGQKESKCTRCSHKETQGIGVTSHDYQWVTTNNPTCTELGEKRYMCSYCDYWEESEAIPKVAHSMGDWETTYEPNCVNPGQKERKCIWCDHKEIQGIGVTNHDYQWVTVSNPTCAQLGEKRYMCIFCDDWDQSKESQVIPTLDHEFRYDVERVNYYCIYCDMEFCDHSLREEKKDPTCDQSGWRYDRCTRCQRKFNVEIIPATGHRMTEFYFYSDGKWITKCLNRNCDHTETVRLMTDYELALYKDDIEGADRQPWVERWLEACANGDEDVYYDESHLYRPDAAQTNDGYLDDYEYGNRSKEFAQIVRNNYMPDATDQNLEFMEDMIKAGNGETAIEDLIPLAIFSNSVGDLEARKQALIDQGYSADSASQTATILWIYEHGGKDFVETLGKLSKDIPSFSVGSFSVSYKDLKTIDW